MITQSLLQQGRTEPRNDGITELRSYGMTEERIYGVMEKSIFFLFLLLLISQHEMRQLVLRVNDVNLFTGSHHQYQVIILKRLKSVKVFLLFLFNSQLGYLPLGLGRFPMNGNAQMFLISPRKEPHPSPFILNH